MPFALRASDPSPRRCARRLAGSLAGLALGVLALAGPAGAAMRLDGIVLPDVGLTQRVVTDRLTGIALSGYDPVAYFVEGRPVRGSAEHETIWNGAAWRFANEGNLAAFLANPAVYAPSYGGYDASAVAAGVATAGDPQVFLVSGNRLYLFRDTTSRERFRDGAGAGGEAHWRTIESGLAD